MDGQFYYDEEDYDSEEEVENLENPLFAVMQAL